MTGLANILYAHTYGTEPLAAAFAPGRVNLIGEHIDYNGGAVLPLSIREGTDVSIGPSVDDQDYIVSVDREENIVRPIDDGPQDHWSDYVAGSLQLARARGWLTGGCQVAIASTMPQGAGLSSSASLIVAILSACAVLTEEQAQTDPMEIALMAQRVENSFVGVPCGIMDQVAVACGKPRVATFLDTATMAHQDVPLPDDWSVIILDSGEQRALSDGQYAALRYRFERAAEQLGVDHLCHAPRCLLDDAGLDQDIHDAALHAIEEHQRTLDMAQALNAQDLATAGQLMLASHASMRDLLGNSTEKVDGVVDAAIKAGAMGARMTGAGFGGAVVALIPDAQKDAFFEALVEKGVGGGLLV